MLVSGNRTENIANCCRIGHFHHAETVIGSLKCPKGINFRYQDVGAKPLGPLCHALAAAAVSTHHKGFPRVEQVGGPKDAVYG